MQDFHRLVFQRFLDRQGTIGVSWLGMHAIKYPTDLWSYQEIIVARRPGLIVETGTHKGGSALFLATICDLIGHGRVISIDIHNNPERDLPRHPRISYVHGDSTDAGIVAAVHASAAEAGEVLVILDSSHTVLHVLAEMEAYAPLVRPGGYLIVEDTWRNGHPDLAALGPGPAEAVAFFLARHPDFAVDPAPERFLMSLNVGGYLRRSLPAQPQD
ncbi:CmcI family methyltransferase [Zavarzinia sp. CC-PAN008]|uniref:CmcI family methyltransferase n=1 Tax=Zavarzinia sp. CC-PAN008 TaxID=3243332 RepID=UPI003F745D04